MAYTKGPLQKDVRGGGSELGKKSGGEYIDRWKKN